MTWEETIQFIRTRSEYKELIELAYFEENLLLNIERFKKSEEYAETKQKISPYFTLDSSIKLLDIGSGNGISAVAFAIDGIQVDSIEPDPSETIGAGAIRKLKEHYHLSNLSVHEVFAEDLKFPDNSFDIVYARQCMHHAHNLKQFLTQCSRVLKKGGLLVTVRDHVIYNDSDKKWFLETHPLQKYYGGENAYTTAEYKSTMKNAGLEIKQELKHYDSVINFFPIKKSVKEKQDIEYENFVTSIIEKKLGILSQIPFLRNMATAYVRTKLIHPFDETKVPGRMYTFLAVKI